MTEDDNSDIVEVTGVSKYYGTKGRIVTALENVSLNVKRLENIAIVGETGSGKTTLGRITCGLETPSRGQVKIDQIESTRYRRTKLWRISQYIHQDPYGAIDNLEDVRTILSRPLRYLLHIKEESEIDEKIIDALRLTGLDESYINKKGGDLSGGEKQRILIARAFISNPKYVVIDEPTTMIDFVHRDEIIDTLANMGRNGNTTLMLITHDIMIVPKIAKKAAVLYRGKIIEYGSVENILKKPLHPYTTFLTSIKVNNLTENKSLLEYLQTYGKERQVGEPSKKGCVYSSICPLADAKCKAQSPDLLEKNQGHFVACFKSGEFRIV